MPGTNHLDCGSRARRSINKCLRYLESKGWDASRYFPGDIYCPKCVSKYGITSVEYGDVTNGTEPPSADRSDTEADRFRAACATVFRQK